jgi:maleylpyruvate isomerase
LNLKGIAYEYAPIHLLKDGGQQLAQPYTCLNPTALVPTLVDDGAVLTQSMAIIEYLDETHPEPRLLPGTALDRVRVRALAQTIACDIAPLNNLRVLRYLKGMQVPDETRDTWYRHWTESGLAALETMLAESSGTGTSDTRMSGTGTFCHGDTPTLADICLVPQMYNARRLKCDLQAMPILLRIDEACRALPAFAKAAPENQPDAE